MVEVAFCPYCGSVIHPDFNDDYYCGVCKKRVLEPEIESYY